MAASFLRKIILEEIQKVLSEQEYGKTGPGLAARLKKEKEGLPSYRSKETADEFAEYERERKKELTPEPTIIKPRTAKQIAVMNLQKTLRNIGAQIPITGNVGPKTTDLIIKLIANTTPQDVLALTKTPNDIKELIRVINKDPQRYAGMLKSATNLAKEPTAKITATPKPSVAPSVEITSPEGKPASELPKGFERDSIIHSKKEEKPVVPHPGLDETIKKEIEKLLKQI